jgi:lysophospholipase L1-like esterase
MRILQWTWAAIIALSGIGLGNAWVEGTGLRNAELAPFGWQKTQAQVPFRRSDLMGELTNNTKGYSLDHFMALHAEAPSKRWDLELALGAGSEVRVLLSAQRTQPTHKRHLSAGGNSLQGAGLLIRRARGGSVNGMAFSAKNNRALSCQGSLPVPTDQIYTLHLETTARGFRATVGTASMECEQVKPTQQGTPGIMSGLHRVQIRSSRTDDNHFSSPKAIPKTAGWILGAGFGLLFWWIERRKGADYRICALTSLPFLLSIPLQSADGLALMEQLRMPGLSPYFFAFWIPLYAGLPLKAVHHLGRYARAQSSWKKGLMWSALGGGLLMASVSALSQPKWPLAIGYFSLSGLVVGTLIGINALAKRLRFVNSLSLCLVVAALGAAEWGVRFTTTGVTWSPTGRMKFDEQLGWTRSTLSDFEALEKEKNSAYPSEGYPIAIANPNSAQRIVCLGSSATGGAFQNDNLNDFYPARLQELIGNTAQVLNQGVGGWTSFHIANYAESKADSLAPDILTLYIGHNDILTKSSAPYKELFGAWKAGHSLQTPLPNWRLFQGFRFAVSTLANPQGAVAVPVEHARENIERLHKMAQKNGAKLLVMPEAITPDSAALTAYDKVLRDLAATHKDIAYLDVPSLLLDTAGDFFLDDVHLSDLGHRRLASAIQETLEDEGWLQPSEGSNEIHE